MSWHPGQALVSKRNGVHRQNPQVLLAPDRGSFFSLDDDRRLSQYLKEHGLEEDTRPYVVGTKTKHWKRTPKKAKGGGD